MKKPILKYVYSTKLWVCNGNNIASSGATPHQAYIKWRVLNDARDKVSGLDEKIERIYGP